jgi:hypothetical protein
MLLQVVAMVIGVLGAMVLVPALGVVGSSAYMIQLLRTVLGVPIAAMSLMGYWRLTQPDPAAAQFDKSNVVRQVIRATVVVQALLSASAVLAQLASISHSSSDMSVAGMSVPITLLSNGTFAVQFFAMMNYLI